MLFYRRLHISTALSIATLSLTACLGGGSSGPSSTPTPASSTSPVAQSNQTEKRFSAFTLATPQTTGSIDERNKTVTLIVPVGTDITALTANFTATGQSVSVGTTPQYSGQTRNDFTKPVTYTITAKDGSSASYSVRVRIMPHIKLTSDPGDYIGGGLQYSFTQDNAKITAKADGGLFSLRIDGNQWWNADFKLPEKYVNIEAGSYQGLIRYPFHNPVLGGLSWGGDGRGCNQLSGNFNVDKAIYEDGQLVEIDLRFEQHCENNVAALRGTIHWIKQ